METEWITCHGWGLNASLFAHWQEHLPDGVSIDHCDRGYTAPPRVVHFSSEAKWRVLWVHSFGLHWCPHELIREADHLVILSGFWRFHPGDPRQGRLSRRGLELMRRQMESDPEMLLDTFLQRVFDPSKAPELERERLNQDLLALDLERLSEVQLNAESVRDVSAVTVIGGDGDRILQPACREELLERLPRQTRWIVYRTEGHAAGITRPDTLFYYLNQSASEAGLRYDE
ncbi:MAG: alpha/beta fold hydrolase [Bacteroidota bacterium]